MNDYSRQPGDTGLPAIQDLSLPLVYRSPSPASIAFSNYREYINTYKSAVSYVTGSHAFKVGAQIQYGTRWVRKNTDGDMLLQLLNGQPRTVVFYATPWTTVDTMNAMLGVFVQDQWTVKRMTVNAGLRFDYHSSSVPAQNEPPAQFVTVARNFAAVPDVPNWKDVSPRLGVSYDLFGNGKTAIKVSLSRYVTSQVIELAGAKNPVTTSVNSATRAWADTNGDFIPQPEELGPLNPSTFGQAIIVTRYDDAVLRGFGERGFNWETSVGLQHQLRPGISVNGGYFRRWYGNFTVTNNLAQPSASFDPFCVPAPVDARLPNSGQPICGLYDITPTLFGSTNNLVTFADSFGTQWEHYNSVDVGVDARLPRGARVGAGLSTGRSETNQCFVVSSPEQLRFCDIRPPFQTQVKFNGSITLPWAFETAGTFQSLPGPAINATWVVPAGLIQTGLGRPAAGNAAKTINLIPPGTIFGDRIYQVDARVAKVLPLGRNRIARAKVFLDLYNLFNASTVLALNTTYGPAWLRPTYGLPGRLLKIGGQLDF